MTFIPKKIWIEGVIALVVFALLTTFFIEVEAFEQIVFFVAKYERWQLDEFFLTLLLSPLPLLWFCLRIGLHTYKAYKKEQQNLEKIKYDQLTGLMTSSYFEQRLEEKSLLEAKGKNTAIIVIAIDNLTTLNHKYSVDVVDCAIQTVATLFKVTELKETTVARIGKHDFAVAYIYKDWEDVTLYIERLMSKLNTNTLINELDMSYKISVACSNIDNYPTAKKLLARAYGALYRAENEIRPSVYLFDQKLEESRLEQAQLRTEFSQAIEEGEVELYYQPQVDVMVNKLVGVEALVRWNHPNRGFLTPDKFIDIIEHEQISLKFCDWLLNESISELERLQNSDIEMTMSINIAPFQLQQLDFPRLVRKYLARFPNVAADKLIFEITEPHKIQDHNSVRESIQLCKELGTRFSLDDFGTGFSSLDQLRKLPVDEIKIDRSFVSNILTDKVDLLMVSSIYSLAKRFSLVVVAEGVEQKEQLSALMPLGCRKVQGYLFSKPMPISDLQLWIMDFKHSQVVYESTKPLQGGTEHTSICGA